MNNVEYDSAENINGVNNVEYDSAENINGVNNVEYDSAENINGVNNVEYDSAENINGVNNVEYDSAENINGVNNVEYDSAENIKEKLSALLLYCKAAYPETKIYISGITPRKDDLNGVVTKINELLVKELESTEYHGIQFIDHSNFDKPEFLYDKKQIHKDNGVRILASNIKRNVKSGTPKSQRRIPAGQERPNKPLEDSQKRSAGKPSSENKTMIDVLEQLKQMNTLLINTHYARTPQPLPPPPPGPWYRSPYHPYIYSVRKFWIKLTVIKQTILYST